MKPLPARKLTPAQMEREMGAEVRALASMGNVSTEYAAKCEKWFYRYLDTGDATEALDFAGFEKPAKYSLSWKAHHLVQRFHALIVRAVVVRRAAIEPLALAVLEEVLQTSHLSPVMTRTGPMLDTDGEIIMAADPKIMAVKVKAADSVLDRGIMPKGLALHGLSPETGEKAETRDFRRLLDRLVEDFGGGAAGAAKAMDLPAVGKYKEYKDYLEAMYPQPKMLNAEPQREGRPS